MLIVERLRRYASKPLSQKRDALRATLRIAPAGCAAAARLAWLNLLSERGRRREIFRDVYKRRLWGASGTTKFFSGTGSRGEAAELYVRRMAALLEAHAGELGRPISVVDIGCGDFEIGGALVSRVPNLTYIGCDIVPELIVHNSQRYATERVSFSQLDVVMDPLPAGDVCLIRQVLQHLSNSEIARVMGRLDYEFLYVTEGQPTVPVGPRNPDKPPGPDVRFDWRTGRGRGVELDQPPHGLETEELFRVAASPTEIIVTTRVVSRSPALAATGRRNDAARGR